MDHTVQEEGNVVKDYIGEDYTTAQCETKCEETAGCLSFSYCNAEKNCHLKDKRLTGSEPQTSNPNCFSSYKTCKSGSQNKYIAT